MSKAIADRVFERFAKKSQDDVPPDFQGNPETHGIDEPRGGGFSIMQKLQKDLVKEEDKKLKDEKAKAARAIEARIVERVTTWFADGTVRQAEREWDDEDQKPVTAAVKRNAFAGAIKEAMYWCGPDRTYRLTKQEQEAGSAICPKCKGQMEKEPFTRQEKMFRCPGCGFKVPTGKITTKKIEIEIEPDGEVEVEVTTANQGRK